MKVERDLLAKKIDGGRCTIGATLRFEQRVFRRVPRFARCNRARFEIGDARFELCDFRFERDANLRQLLQLRLRLFELASCVIQRDFRFALFANERFDFLLQLRHARAERHDDA